MLLLTPAFEEVRTGLELTEETPVVGMDSEYDSDASVESVKLVLLTPAFEEAGMGAMLIDEIAVAVSFRDTVEEVNV